ncbi:structure-specific endonuclease subunit SLX4 isoform X1 [Tribolium castaneum]|uniref:structure-specific endonuclease subunit SLX4 isoform X1 n=1 Tax=Tribolium castaneum TaxID=7070 RepID=UPI00046BF410|nr:PREDICTED: structure-specific endonuclease subunit SLX4 isoform X1 [Tribolium castaneum]|eukprot:XP_976493.2 PREDICTED: structure-specific endonuclease subunit SLX4 isoform X1 [Tribolium castaneum]
MSSTRTKRSRSRGTQNSTQSQTSKPVKRSATKTGKISKYFAKITKDNAEGSESSGSFSDSPYKNCLSEVKLDDSAGNLADFETPKAINKVSKIANAKPPCKNVKKRKKTQVPLTKFVEDNFKHVDVNPDHLQMALALSESTYAAENPGQTLSSQEKIDSFRGAFEKFGFGYNKSRVSVQEKKERLDPAKKSKKSRYRHVTPILKIRTSEERESLISSKVSLILAQNERTRLPKAQETLKLFSAFLQKLTKRKIFPINNLALEELNEEGRFYVQGFEPSTGSSCGRFLKDWGSIPGRERTPERVITSNVPKLSQSYLQSDKENLEPEENAFRENSPQPSPWTRLSVCESPNFIYNDSLFASEKREERRNSRVIDLTNSDESSNENKNFECNTSQIIYGKFPSPAVKLGEEDFSKRGDDNPFSSEISSVISPNKDASSPSGRSEEGVNSSFQIYNSPKLCLSPQLSPITPSYQGVKRSRDCISPDLFESESEHQLSRNNEEEMECFDLTQSDNEETTSFHVSRSAPDDSVESSLNVTEYVNNLLSGDQTSPQPRRLEKISTSDDDSPEKSCSQESIYISDDEVNYSSVFSEKKVQYEFSDDEEFDIPDMELSLSERLGLKNSPNFSDLSKAGPSDTITNEDSPLKACSPPLETFNSTLQQVSPNNEKVELEDFSIDRQENLGEKTQYNFSNDEEFGISNMGLSLSERLRLKSAPKASNLSEAGSSHEISDHGNSPVRPLSPQMVEFEDQSPDKQDMETPNKSSIIIKTDNVTPMANYDEMNTPQVCKELDKFGLKPLKRSKGAKLLKYIYEATHPIVEDNDGKIVKKRRTNNLVQFNDIIGDVGEEEELIFERTQSKRIASCRLPLHIAWHNLVMSNPKIREDILLYEPLQLENLHSMLKEQGFKYNIQDLLTFLDKKCITIRTAQGQRSIGKKQ